MHWPHATARTRLHLLDPKHQSPHDASILHNTSSWWAGWLRDGTMAMMTCAASAARLQVRPLPTYFVVQQQMPTEHVRPAQAAMLMH